MLVRRGVKFVRNDRGTARVQVFFGEAPGSELVTSPALAEMAIARRQAAAASLSLRLDVSTCILVWQGKG